MLLHQIKIFLCSFSISNHNNCSRNSSICCEIFRGKKIKQNWASIQMSSVIFHRVVLTKISVSALKAFAVILRFSAGGWRHPARIVLTFRAWNWSAHTKKSRNELRLGFQSGGVGWRRQAVLNLEVFFITSITLSSGRWIIGALLGFLDFQSTNGLRLVW